MSKVSIDLGCARSGTGRSGSWDDMLVLDPAALPQTTLESAASRSQMEHEGRRLPPPVTESPCGASSCPLTVRAALPLDRKAAELPRRDAHNISINGDVERPFQDDEHFVAVGMEVRPGVFPCVARVVVEPHLQRIGLESQVVGGQAPAEKRGVRRKRAVVEPTMLRHAPDSARRGVGAIRRRLPSVGGAVRVRVPARAGRAS